MADQGAFAAHTPRRGSDVDAWLKRHRDRYKGRWSADHLWHLIDGLINDYRDHADTGVPLDSDDAGGPHSDRTADDLIDELAVRAGTAKDALMGTMAALCPGGAEHGWAPASGARPAWCSLCRRTEWGVKV